MYKRAALVKIKICDILGLSAGTVPGLVSIIIESDRQFKKKSVKKELSS